MEGSRSTHNFEYNAAYNNQSDLQALSSAFDNDGADKFFGIEPLEENAFEEGLHNIKQEVFSPMLVDPADSSNLTTDTSEYSTPCSSVRAMLDSSATPLAHENYSPAQNTDELDKINLSGDLVDSLNYAMKTLRMATLKRINTPARKSVKFDGLPLLIPREKEHQMETRLDTEVNTPKIHLRTRSVARFSEVGGLLGKPCIESAMALPEMTSAPLEMTSAPLEITCAPPEMTSAPSEVTIAPLYVQPLVLNNIRIKPFECDDRKRKASPMAIVQPVKYISMAEKIIRFQKATPDRFHTLPRTGDVFKPNPSRLATRCTVPQSPAFQAKLRARPVNHPTREQIEEEELKEVQSHKVKAHPLNPKVFQEPKLGVRVEKRPLTAIEPFKLTEVKKKVLPDKPTFTFTARPVPKGIYAGPTGLSEKLPASLTNPVTPLFVRRRGTPKRTAPVIDQKNNEKMLGKHDIYHFGVPMGGGRRTPTPVKHMKRSTDTVPFSFEERDKLAQQKKEEKIKTLLETEKKAREFHANPLPRFVDENNVVVSHLLTDGYAERRRERIRKKMQEEEEELKKLVAFKARPATVVHTKPFEVKKSELPLQEICPFEFNTERRAKEWEEYEKVLKANEDEMEESKKILMEQIKVQELEEINRLRKETVHKANPVRRFKAFEIKPSEKTLTTPLSPFIKKTE